MASIVFVGCGIMGSKLINAFMEEGHNVAIVNRTFEKAKPFIERGATYFPSLSEALKLLSPAAIVINVDSYETGTEIVSSAAAHINNKVVVNLSTGGPKKVLAFNDLIHSLGGKFIVGVLTCYPKNIGAHRDGSLVYAGNAVAYRNIKKILDALSPINIYIGENVTHAPIFDNAWLAAHWGTYWGLIQAAAICKANGISIELFAEEIKGMIAALVDLVRPNLISMIGADNFGPAVDATIFTHAIGLRETISSCEESGVDPSVFHVISDLCNEAIASGDGHKNIEVIVNQILGR